MGLSVTLGAAIGIGYGLMAYGMQRLVAPTSPLFMGMMLIGMLARMVLLLGTVALVAIFAPIEKTPFVLALVPALLVSLTVEAWLSYKRLTRPAAPAPETTI